jgi:hypothetical protein
MYKMARVLNLASEIRDLQQQLSSKKEELTQLIGNGHAQAKEGYFNTATCKKLSKKLRKYWASKTPEQIRQWGDRQRQVWASKSPEDRSKWVAKIIAARRGRAKVTA